MHNLHIASFVLYWAWRAIYCMEINCAECGKTIKRPISQVKQRQKCFCSRACYNKYQKTLTGDKNNHYTRVKHICPLCGKEFNALPSKIKEYKNTFCSKQCKNAYMYNYTGGEKNAKRIIQKTI